MNKTSEQILNILERQRTATAAQLSRSLQVSAADIRFHLGQLAEAELVEIAGMQRTGERGRPRRLYRLASRARAANLSGLARALLQVIEQQLGAQGMADTARMLADRPREVITPAGRRLYQAVQQLNDLHYQARWEAHADSPRILLGNCPYAAILHEHPELCRMDKHLIEQLTGLPAEQTARLETSPRGEIFCLFQLQPQPGLPVEK
jgi:predicted ArsR family transcriptional regulator